MFKNSSDVQELTELTDSISVGLFDDIRRSVLNDYMVKKYIVENCFIGTNFNLDVILQKWKDSTNWLHLIEETMLSEEKAFEIEHKECSLCGITVNKKDVQVHLRVCSGEPLEKLSLLPHGYILKGVLCAKVSKIKGGVKFPQNIKPVVLMHPSTMKVLKFVRGGYVVINANYDPTVHRSWPCTDVDPSCVAFAKGLSFKNYSGHVSLHHYVEPSDIAREVLLSPKEPKDFMASKIFNHYILEEIGDVFVRRGMVLSLNYLGAPCELEIVEIRGITSNSPRMSLNQEKILDTVTPATFFKVQWKTIITIVNQCEATKNAIQKKVLFKNIGGLKDQIKTIQTLLHPFLSPDLSKDVNLPTGLLFYGPPGTGKSLTALAISNECHVPFITVKKAELYSRYYGAATSKLRRVFEEASERAPSIIFLDDLGLLYPEKSNPMSIQDRSILDALPALFEGLSRDPGKRVLVIAATNKPERIDSVLRRQNRLEKEISFEIPQHKERKQILNTILENFNHELTEKHIASISNNAHGFTGSDLDKLCRKALLRTREKTTTVGNKSHITFPDMMDSIKDIKQSVMRGFTFEIPEVYWNEIGGMHLLKQEITDIIDLPLKKPEAFHMLGITPSRGVLLYGPPGCCKTMIAKALATESKLNFISIKGPELFSKWVGESERAVRDLFQKARSAAPCIIFFDEFDSLAAKRCNNLGGSNVGDRVVIQLLTEIDGVDVLQGVSLLAATNRPDLIDPAFLRPGRFDRVIHVPLPDSCTRKEILGIKMKKMPIADDVDIMQLVNETAGYSGVEIVAACDSASRSVMAEDLTSTTSVVSMTHFKKALTEVSPRTPLRNIEFYELFSSQYRQQF